MFKSQRSLRLLAAGLLLSNLVTLGLLVHARYQNWWQQQVWELHSFGFASHAALLQADKDFRQGDLRYYELAADGEQEFADKMKGPFEVWHYPFAPQFEADKFLAKTYVERYNTRMHYRRSHESENDDLPSTDPASEVDD